MLAGALAQSSNYLETEMYFLPTTYFLPLEQSTFGEFFASKIFLLAIVSK